MREEGCPTANRCDEGNDRSGNDPRAVLDKSRHHRCNRRDKRLPPRGRLNCFTLAVGTRHRWVIRARYMRQLRRAACLHRRMLTPSHE